MFFGGAPGIFKLQVCLMGDCQSCVRHVYRHFAAGLVSIPDHKRLCCFCTLLRSEKLSHLARAYLRGHNEH